MGFALGFRQLWQCRATACGVAAALAVTIATALVSAAHGQSATPPKPTLGPSGQPVPRYVSLKADRVNVRRGPGPDHGIDWVYRRAGLPVEIIAESEIWRRVRDAEGATGWVLASLLSGRRTALVEPWELKPNAQPPEVPLKLEAREAAGDIAQIEAGVLANVRSCDGRWCLVTVGDYRGYIEQRRLWGVYKGEALR